jgi:hypothetical protein
VSVNADDVEDFEDASDSELIDMFYEFIQNDFEQRVHPTPIKTADEFVVWAKEVLQRRKTEEGK